jgi:hypothetical protein
MIEDDGLPGSARPNVFALPSETTLRFVLLVGSLIAGVLVVAESLYYIVDQDGLNAVLRTCTTQTASLTDPAEQATAMGRCQAPHERHRVLWTLATLLVAVAVGVVVVLVLPAVRRRRRHVQPLPGSLGVDEVVGDMCARLGVDRAPTTVWDPRRIGGAAEVWWNPGRPVIELSPGLVVGLRRREAGALAVLAHEAAHMRNRDLVLGATTDAAVFAFALTALLPLAVGMLVWFDGGWTTTVSAIARVALVGVAILLARAATLRSREVGADGRAAETTTTSERGAAVHERSSRMPLWRAPLHHHPSPATRSSMLATPVRLLDVGWVDGLIAGFVSFVYLPTIIRLVQAWFSGSPRQSGALVWVCALFAAPLGLWLGVVAIRIAAAGVIDGRVRNGLVLGSGMAVGALAGLLLLDEPLFLSVRPLDGGWVEAIILAVLAVALVGLAAWASAVARAHLDSGRRGPIWAILPVVAVTCFGVTIVTAKLAESWRLSRIGSSLVIRPGGDALFGAATLLWTVAATPWFTVLALAVAVLPVVARGRSGGAPRWLGATRNFEPPPRDRALLRSAIIGVVTGVVAALAFVVYDERIRSVTSSEELNSSTIGFRYILTAEFLVIGVALLGALAVSLTSRRRGVIHALFALAVAGTIGSAGVIVKLLRRLSELDWEIVRQVAGQIIPLAVVAGLAAASVLTLLTGRLSTKRTVVAGLAIVVVGCCVAVGLSFAGVAYATKTLPARRETLGPYRAWTTSNDVVIGTPFAGCLDVATLAQPGVVEQARSAVRTARSAVDRQIPSTAEVRHVHEHLRRALDACDHAVETFARGADASADGDRSIAELTTWNDGLGKLTDGTWSPLET